MQPNKSIGPSLLVFSHRDKGISHILQMQKLGLRKVIQLVRGILTGSQLWSCLTEPVSFLLFLLFLPLSVFLSLPLNSSLTPTFLPLGASHLKLEHVPGFAFCSFSTGPCLSAHFLGWAAKESQVFRAPSVLLGGLTEIPSH